jgi:peptidoglycan/xylan/chitin deacetylase (PgdA/CDA1 family)
MALPAEFNTVTIHGRWVLLDGTVAVGTVRFTGGVVLRAPQSDTIVVPATFTVSLDGNGEISLQLPATNDSDLTPIGWAYTVSEVLTGFTRTYNISVPWDTVGTIELADLATVPEVASSPVASPYVTRVNGLTGDVVLPQGPVGPVGPTGPAGAPGPSSPASAQTRVSDMIYAGEPYPPMGSLGGGAVTMHDTTDRAIGSGSAKVVTPGVPGVACGFGVFSGPTLPDLTGKEIVLWLKITGIANTPDFSFWVGNSGLGNAYRWSIADSGTDTWLRDGDWWRVTLPFGSATISGTTPPLDTLNSWELAIYDNGIPITLQFGGFGYVPRQSKWPNGVVTIRFDDLFASQFTTAAPYMARYGFGATSYVIAETLYNNAAFGGGYATLAQAHTLEDLFGWEHASHADKAAVHNQTVGQGGTGTVGYTAYPEAAQLDDMHAVQEYLRTQGFRAPGHFAWPQGAWDATSRACARRVFSSAMTTKNANHESVPPADPYRVRCYSPPNTVTGAELTAEVAKAVAGKEWLTILFHNIVASPGGSVDTSTESFTTLIDYLAAQDIPVRLVSEVMAQRF